MAEIKSYAFEVPYRSQVIDSTSMLSSVWQEFFKRLHIMLSPLGIEKSFPLENNATNKDIEGMQFDFKKVNQITVEYLIQRITTAPSATELIQAGVFMVVRKPTAGTWHIVNIGSTGPDAAGITFSMSTTTQGQVLYTSTNITGTPNISKITYRARTLGARVAT